MNLLKNIHVLFFGQKLTLALLLADMPLSLIDILLRLPARLGVSMLPGVVPVELVILLLGPTVNHSKQKINFNQSLRHQQNLYHIFINEIQTVFKFNFCFL